MGRRSDHSREQLEELIVSAGNVLMAEVGFARFSARAVAKRIGYSVGTIYNVFGSLDNLLLAINGRTFVDWAARVRSGLEDAGEGLGADRLKVLVDGYFDFAEAHPNLWHAIYDHRVPPGTELPDRYAGQRAELTGLVGREIAQSQPHASRSDVERLARSLVATVHGHCLFALNGTFDLLGGEDARARAMERVREGVAGLG